MMIQIINNVEVYHTQEIVTVLVSDEIKAGDMVIWNIRNWYMNRLYVDPNGAMDNGFKSVIMILK